MIFGVIAVVVFRAAETIKREDLCRHTIEKVTVVTDRDDCAFKRRERAMPNA